jgi:regulator of protease activity HflC (stomatin/prohibitin superfamily)
MLQERVVKGFPGWAMVALLLAALAAAIALLVNSAQTGELTGGLLLVLVLVMVLDLVAWAGLTVVNPNTAKVVLLFGRYKGSLKTPGFWWVNPLTLRRPVSLRTRNFESGKLKVNDHIGNPIEIAAIVVWRVIETAEALFQVDDYEHFVHVQTESALRVLATTYPYDAHVEGETSLRGSAEEVSKRLRDEIQDRLAKAGVDVIEARISHLAYAPEIANAMLRRQQASAIIAARQKIVEGAVGMVEMALEQLSAKRVVEFDEERKATMVSNLLVVLCGDRDAQPVVNTGTLYQ